MYKFRGKRIDNGEWVYGYLCGYVNDGNVACIATEEMAPDMVYHCHPDSIGMWTGVRDKAGVDIYENDFVNWKGMEMSDYMALGKDLIDLVDEIGVTYSHNEWCRSTPNQCEVIGNTTDNPELLGE